MRLDKIAKGFTLIEMMIVVAIISILAAIAIPNYNNYVRRSKLTEAASTLSDLRVRMEQYYQDNRNYGSTGTTCGTTMPTAPAVKYFTYTCVTSSSAQAYTITAASADVSLGANGAYTYTLDQSNTKTTTKFKAANQTGKNCWLMTGSEC